MVEVFATFVEFVYFRVDCQLNLADKRVVGLDVDEYIICYMLQPIFYP